MPDSIEIESLTTEVEALTSCLVTPGGASIRLNFDDTTGGTTTLILSTACVHQLVKTLPHLLSNALRAQHGDCSARRVFQSMSG